jgi:uncharacterized membrane protein
MDTNALFTGVRALAAPLAEAAGFAAAALGLAAAAAVLDEPPLGLAAALAGAPATAGDEAGTLGAEAAPEPPQAASPSASVIVQVNRVLAIRAIVRPASLQQGMANVEATTQSEPRWPASLAVAAAIVLYATLPERYTLGPAWLIPGLEGALLVGLSVTAPRRRPEEAALLRIAAVALIALVTFANFFALWLLIDRLLSGAQAEGSQLVFAAIQMWMTNVLVFALWFWELDRGGPSQRRQSESGADFLFPQMTSPAIAPAGWQPKFVDYLYVSFTNAMAFSPTDTLPLSRWAKLLMLAESMASLLTVAFVAARAVNILS